MQATMIGQVATSSSCHYTYDVFLNFRGKDTRSGFTGNLYHALTQKGIHTFFDDEEIRKGDKITTALVKAIQESRMAITVFSKDYASSAFCLDELVEIHHCIMQKGRPVWPIFYDVEPSEVRYQNGNYKQALDMHKEKSRADEEKMGSWKLALREVADLSGKHVKSGNGYEHQCIDEIVKQIFREINNIPLHVAQNPVGLDSRQQKINSLLELGSKDKVIMVGICGIGGIGKTTLARAVYNSIGHDFEGLCFLDDIKENSKKLGLEIMLERMLSNLLRVDIKIDGISRGVSIIKQRLNKKKILLILDNVDQGEQLQNFAGNCDWFGAGSRIIITTRDKHLLVPHGVERKYDMELFNHEESNELLCRSAFKNAQYDPSFEEVVNGVICYAQGLPLALKVIGSHLYGMSKREWESALNAYKRIPIEDIQQILKVSYDDLNCIEKEIFLDIACFYKGNDLEYIKHMTKVHQDHPDYLIKRLENKCLITIEKGRVGMHDLIQDMGRKIVLQESNEPGERSRLWSPQEIVHILEENTGTNKVRMIISDNWSECIEADWDGEAFEKMTNLKVLIFRNSKFSKGPKYLPNSLVVMKWGRYPSSCLPPNFHPKNLLELDLGRSCFNSVETIKKMPSLSVLDLRRCEYVTHIPNLSGLSSLKELRLPYCKNLLEIDDSVGELQNLEFLDASYCTQLKTLPRHVTLPSLSGLLLKRCRSLTYFPEIIKSGRLVFLCLDGTGVEKLPPSIVNFTSLSTICIAPTYGRLFELPSSIFQLPKLSQILIYGCEKILMEQGPKQHPNIRTLTLRRCNISDEILQVYLTSFINIVKLDLRGNIFTTLPECIKQCHRLRSLNVSQCKHLSKFEGIPPNMKVLYAQGCISLSSELSYLLLSEELLRRQVMNDAFNDNACWAARTCVPGSFIPEWFKYRSKEASISFWFRNNFPTLCVCALLNSFPEIDLRVVMNEKEIKWARFPGLEWLFEDEGNDIFDHILVFELGRRYFDEDKMKRALREGEWNHVEVYMDFDSEIYIHFDSGGYFTFNCFVLEMGIGVMEQHSAMKDIRFTSPFDDQGNYLKRGEGETPPGIQGPDWEVREEEGTRMQETKVMLKGKRKLIEDETSASNSTAFRFKKERRNCSTNQQENNANSTEIEFASASETIGIQAGQQPSAMSKETLHDDILEDKTVCQTQFSEQQEDEASINHQISYSKYQVMNPNYISDSNGESLTKDPMEYEHELTYLLDNRRDP